MKRIFFFFLVFIYYLIFPALSLAQELNQFVTIVNPIRISKYNLKLAESLLAEYSVIKKYRLPATWLLTYDAVRNKEVNGVLAKMGEEQEVGIFLEVTPGFTAEAGVVYHDTGFWHYATSVFLSGYLQDERKKMIDEVFETFKSVFGFYPKSVGAWWIDSYSLAYMQEKYGITSVLGCSDQFSTDGYQIWGQPWVLPYYPSKYHFGVPAKELREKIDVVKIQWAPRDPLWGYENSLYSTQDYLQVGKNLDISYFEKLVKLYAGKNGNDFGQVTLGLEADLDPSVYGKEFEKQMVTIANLRDQKEAKVTNMGQFSSWYQGKYPKLSPEYKLESQDLLGGNKKVFWYQSPFYRISSVLDPDSQKLVIRDLRFYLKGMQEPNFLSPNYNFNLSIFIPPVFDQINYAEDVWELPLKVEIETFPEKIVIKNIRNNPPSFLIKNPFLKVEKRKNEIEISLNGFSFPENGIVTKDFSVEARHFFRQKKFLLALLTGRGWENFRKVEYFIPQEELYTLSFLVTLPHGKVLVFDNECLQCLYHTPLKPLFMSGSKSYVSKFGKHPILSNISVFKAGTREEARKELRKSGVKYVYLVKFEDYNEILPFSPGDLGVEKIYANQNAEIWQVK